MKTEIKERNPTRTDSVAPVEVCGTRQASSNEVILTLRVQRDNLLQFAKLVMAEWDSDPRSTQCFDSAIIRMGKAAITHAELKA